MIEGRFIVIQLLASLASGTIPVSASTPPMSAAFKQYGNAMQDLNLLEGRWSGTRVILREQGSTITQQIVKKDVTLRHGSDYLLIDPT